MKLRLLPVVVAAVAVLSGSYASSESASDSVTYDSLMTLGNRQLDNRSFEDAAVILCRRDRSLAGIVMKTALRLNNTASLSFIWAVSMK